MSDRISPLTQRKVSIKKFGRKKAEIIGPIITTRMQNNNNDNI